MKSCSNEWNHGCLGLPRFSRDIHSMLGFDVGRWWKFCWIFCAPLFLVTIIVFGLYDYEPLEYDGYVYPGWANVLGFIIAASSVLCIPIMAVYQFVSAPGSSFREKLTFIITPYFESRQFQPPVTNPANIVYNSQTLDSTCVWKEDQKLVIGN